MENSEIFKTMGTGSYRVLREMSGIIQRPCFSELHNYKDSFILQYIHHTKSKIDPDSRMKLILVQYFASRNMILYENNNFEVKASKNKVLIKS